MIDIWHKRTIGHYSIIFFLTTSNRSWQHPLTTLERRGVTGARTGICVLFIWQSLCFCWDVGGCWREEILVIVCTAQAWCRHDRWKCWVATLLGLSLSPQQPAVFWCHTVGSATITIWPRLSLPPATSLVDRPAAGLWLVGWWPGPICMPDGCHVWRTAGWWELTNHTRAGHTQSVIRQTPPSSSSSSSSYTLDYS